MLDAPEDASAIAHTPRRRTFTGAWAHERRLRLRGSLYARLMPLERMTRSTASRITAPMKAMKMVPARPAIGACHRMLWKSQPPIKAPTTPMTMSPPSPYPPLASAFARKPATPPTTTHSKKVSIVMSVTP
jgi:hypothetical protein